MFSCLTQIDNSLGLFFRSHIDTISLVIINAVNTEVTIPIDKVTANPLTGPVPKKNKTNEAIRVVILASRIVPKDLEYPDSTAAKGLLPLKYSSLIRSKIITFESTAIPIVKTMPAIPGNVKVA
jgi:hypothetical protein